MLLKKKGTDLPTEAEKIMLGENKLKSLDQRNFALSRAKQ